MRARANGPSSDSVGLQISNVQVTLLLCGMLTMTACGLAVPRGAYQPVPGSAQSNTIGWSLFRAALAAGEKFENSQNWKFGFIRSSEINATTSGARTFYFTDGLAAEPEEVIEAVIAHEVAHEVLGHVGRAILTRLAISTAFAVGGIFVPGLQYADYAVNPLVTNAFDRAQEIEADLKAVQILGKMGYDEPESVLLNLLTRLKNQYGAVGGGLLDSHPNIEDRIIEIVKLQPMATERSNKRHIADELAARVRKECEDKRIRGELSGYVEETRCGNDRVRAIYSQSGSQEDLLFLDVNLAYQMALAKRIDEKVSSVEEGKLQMAELRINGEIARRNSAASKRLGDALGPSVLRPPTITCVHQGNTTTCN